MELLILIGVVWVIWAWTQRDSSTSSSSTPPRHHISKSNGTGQRQPLSEVSSHRSAVNEESSVELIESAIQSTRLLHFRYVDQEGEVSERTVTPYYLERRHEAQVLCLVAHCHLRNAERTFVVHRMRRLRVN